MSGITIRRVARAVLAGTLLMLLMFSTSSAHRLTEFWRYDPWFFNHTWKKHEKLRHRHSAWHKDHPNPTRSQHNEFHHLELNHRHRRHHRHRVIEQQAGEAAWFRGDVGACGKPLDGHFAAHRRWPCGSLVSVRHGRRHVFVKILDRGPFDGRRIDLSRSAFRKLASPSRGVIDVKVYRLER